MRADRFAAFLLLLLPACACCPPPACPPPPAPTPPAPVATGPAPPAPSPAPLPAASAPLAEHPGPSVRPLGFAPASVGRVPKAPAEPRVAAASCPKWLGYRKDDDARMWYARVRNTKGVAATISLCVKTKDGTRVHYAEWTSAGSTVDIAIGRVEAEPEVESYCCDCEDPCK